MYIKKPVFQFHNLFYVACILNLLDAIRNELKLYKISAWWRWQHKYMHPRKAGIAGYYQLTVGCMMFFYVLNYQKICKCALL